MRTPEGSVKADIKKLLDSYGDELYYFMPVQMGMGRRTVDFLICFKGRFFGIEAKRKGKKAQKFQEKIIHSINLAGGYSFWVDDVQALKDAFKWLDSTPYDPNTVNVGTVKSLKLG